MIPPVQNSPKMDHPKRPDVKYLLQHCPFLKKEVWAILTQQMDGSLKIVNCLDKDSVCFQQPCAFTSDGGERPFDTLRSAPFSTRHVLAPTKKRNQGVTSSVDLVLPPAISC